MKLVKFIALVLCGAMLMSLCACADTENKEDEIDMTLKTKSFTASDEYVKQIGRVHFTDDVLWLVQSASAAEFTVNGTSLTVTMQGDSSANGFSTSNARFAVYVDGERVADECMTEPENTVTVKLGDEPREATVKIIKLSESAQSIVGIKSIEAECIGHIAPTAEKDLKIEFIGDSITCAYGVDDEDRDHHFSTHTEDATKSYAYKTAETLGADYSLVCYSGHGIISAYTGDGTINESGLVPKIYTQLGKTWGTTDPDVNKIEWDFDKFQPDYVVINLGTNDSSYVKGNAEKAQVYAETYTEFLKDVRKNNPDAHIICSLGVMGADLYPYIEQAVAAYTAETGDANISCLKFDGIDPADGYAADWHPVEATHTKAAAKLAEYIEGLEG